MSTSRTAYVHEATLRLGAGVDPAEVGGAVTVELCGSWDHAGGCRWPHNNDIRVDGRDATFRTVFAADPSDAREVHDRIELALHTAPGWVVVASGPREVAVNEQALAANLDETPPPTRFQGGDG